MQDSRPTLLLIAGPPGAGKSTLATAVGRATSWPVLDKDTIKTCLLRLGADESLAGPASYDLLLDLTRDLMSQGHSVILDAPGKYRSFLDRCARVADAHDACFRIALCQAHPHERQRRLSARDPRLSQWSSLGDARPGDDACWEDVFPDDALVVDTSVSVDDLGTFVIAQLREHDP